MSVAAWHPGLAAAVLLVVNPACQRAETDDDLAWEATRAALAEQVGFSSEYRAEWCADMLRWPQELTGEWLREEFALEWLPTEEELHCIDQAVGDLNAELIGRFEEYLDSMESVLRAAWAEDRFAHGRLAEDGTVSPWHGSRQALYRSFLSDGAWVARVELLEQDHPRLAGLYHALHTTVERRDSLARRVLMENESRGRRGGYPDPSVERQDPVPGLPLSGAAAQDG